MNVFAKFDEIPSMILQDIKETKRYRNTVGCSFGRTFGRTDNVKTVYPHTNIVCGGYNYYARFHTHSYHCCSEMHFSFRLEVNFDKVIGARIVGQRQQVMVHAPRVFEGQLLCKVSYS